jgi:hypothetical protein
MAHLSYRTLTFVTIFILLCNSPAYAIVWEDCKNRILSLIHDGTVSPEDRTIFHNSSTRDFPVFNLDGCVKYCGPQKDWYPVSKLAI